MTLARTSAEARREEFVEAAIKVMAREGLDHATTRRIAEEAGAPQGIFHYLFRGKTELLAAVTGAVTQEVEQVLREAVDPRKGLAAAISDAVQVFWQHVLSDDGLQLMQYELVIYCRRTPGLEWLADWQYARYIAAATEVLGAAAEHDAARSAISLDQLVRFLVAAVDGLVLQYTVHHDAEQSQHDVSNVIAAAIALTGLGTQAPSKALAPGDPARANG
jgi:AcrR family transcriptional regulator